MKYKYKLFSLASQVMLLLLLFVILFVVIISKCRKSLYIKQFRVKILITVASRTFFGSFYFMKFLVVLFIVNTM